MRLKSLTLKGFKSFPDRTHLDFGPGVSVVVGPNGSGKSNVTDAVLWAMGEQSPLAVRGQSMQDVIFGGGRGVQARSAAEVEIVLDNSDGTVDLPLSEISIVRRLDRAGEGGYRLNGARCRLTDVIDVLSDTGLGKETHSVVSQGRVEAIVTSKPRDRRLLIEEAAGLGKHRKRRRRAQLKLEKTQENLDRALDVEREARTRLWPPQAPGGGSRAARAVGAPDAGSALGAGARGAARARGGAGGGRGRGQAGARRARGDRDAATGGGRAPAGRPSVRSVTGPSATTRWLKRVYDARSARERLGLRGEQAGRERAGAGAEDRAGGVGPIGDGPAHAQRDRGRGRGSQARRGRRRRDSGEPSASEQRIGALEGELAEIESQREREIEREIEGLERRREQEIARVTELEQALEQARTARTEADELAEQARVRLQAAEREAQDTRREAARVGGELAVANQFLRSHAGVVGDGGAERSAVKTLSEELSVRDGYELALAAALGGRLSAALVRDRAGRGGVAR